MVIPHNMKFEIFLQFEKLAPSSFDDLYLGGLTLQCGDRDIVIDPVKSGIGGGFVRSVAYSCPEDFGDDYSFDLTVWDLEDSDLNARWFVEVDKDKYPVQEAYLLYLNPNTGKVNRVNVTVETE